MSEADESLVAQAVAGDFGALSMLLERQSPALRASFQIDRKWSSVLDPDDVLQVTFLEAFLRIGQFRPAGPGAFSAWLNRIAQNNLRDAVRELSRAKRPQPAMRVAASPAEESMSLLLNELGVTTTTPSRAAATQEMRSAVESAVSMLPADYAAVVRHYDLEGRSIADVAAAMGRSAGAVHMLRSRAHEYLRELLGSDSRFRSESA